MKAEYSYYADSPSLVIKAADFLKAMRDREEHFLLEVAVDGFAAKFDAIGHYSDEVNEEIQNWLTKTGSVIYTIKERWVGRTLLSSWCEVYVQNGTRLIEVVISDNGRDFSLHKKQEEPDHE